MLRSPIEDAIYSLIIWTPILALITWLALLATGGLMQYEAKHLGSEVFISNEGEVHPELDALRRNKDLFAEAYAAS